MLRTGRRPRARRCARRSCAQGRECRVTARLVEVFAHPPREAADEVERVVGGGAKAHRLVKALEGDVREARVAEDRADTIGVGERERARGIGRGYREITADRHGGAELGEPLVVVDALPGEKCESTFGAQRGWMLANPARGSPKNIEPMREITASNPSLSKG